MRSQIDSAGRPAVHGDAHAGNERGARRYQEAHEIGEFLREVYEPGVGDASREVARGRVARGGTNDVDDASATLRLHDREDGPGHPNVAEDLQAPVPRPLLVGDLQEVSTPDCARVVHEDVEPAEAIPHRGGNPV